MLRSVAFSGEARPETSASRGGRRHPGKLTLSTPGIFGSRTVVAPFGLGLHLWNRLRGRGQQTATTARQLEHGFDVSWVGFTIRICHPDLLNAAS